MRVLVDADGCPVVGETVRLCRKYGVSCILFCDTSHQFSREGAQTVIVDKGADSADFALANRTCAGDLVVTQDYGLAAMCMARGADAVNQNGMRYTEQNIDALLEVRAANRRIRASGGRIRGPARRTQEQDAAFTRQLEALLQKEAP